MNIIYGILLAFGCVGTALGKGSEKKEKHSCQLTGNFIAEPWTDMETLCVDAMRDQVQIETAASVTYLAMGSYFSQDSVNRPGFAELFFKSATEEREHALKVLDYISMRGYSFNRASISMKSKVHTANFTTGIKALNTALQLEVEVTNAIRAMIATCENPLAKRTADSPNPRSDPTPETPTLKNDYHLVDYLTSDFLDEQYKGQRDLAGKITNLGKLIKQYKHLGEFLFDQKLLHGEI